MISDIKSYVANCEICQKVKITQHTRQPMMISSTPVASFANIAIDHVGKLSQSVQGNEYILTCMCVLTKFAIAMPVPDNGAESTARNLVEKVFLIFGYPEMITSDNHKTFQSNLLKEIRKILKIQHVFTSPYTPKSNTVERFHASLHNMLRSFIADQPAQWENKLQFVVSSYNSCVNSVTGVSPFELVFGKTMQLPHTITRAFTPSYNYDSYAHEMRENLQYGWKLAREKLINRKEQNKEYFDKRNKTKNLELKIGDLVLMKNMERKTKYDMLYTGPYEVTEISGPNSVRLKNNKNKYFRVHKVFSSSLSSKSLDRTITNRTGDLERI